MKTIVAVLLLSVAAGADTQDAGPDPVEETFGPGIPADAPVVIINPDGSVPNGRSAKITVGTPAPFSGRLIDDQEFVRRARINERNAAELADSKKGTVLLSIPVAIAIAVGLLGLGFGGGVAVVKLTEKRPAQ